MGRINDERGMNNTVEDTSPQLGGNLDVNGNKIVSTSNGDIDIEPNGTGDVLLGNFTFDADQSVGAGQDNYVLTYDNAGGKISLEAAAGGGDFADGGEAGGAARSLGNTDNYDLHFLTNNQDRLHISADGRVGIGATADALTIFETQANEASVHWVGQFNNLSDQGAAQYGILVTAGSGINDFVLRVMSRSAAADLFSVRGNGNVYMPQYSNGTLSISSGLITSSSDEVLKENITPLYSSLDKLLQLNPVTFEWKDANISGVKIGFTAQDVEAQFPELVGQPTKEGGGRGLYYAEMTAVLTKSIQELNAQVQELKAEIEILKGK